jgi:NifU-like protein involved in Fe-S cluster formation
MGRFSATLQDHFSAPRNVGPIEFPTVVATATRGGQAPRLTLQLRIESGRIIEAGFNTFGCGVAIACGSVLTELITGEDIEYCARLNAGDIVCALDGIPADKRFCAKLAIDSLHQALCNSSCEVA